MAKWEGTQSIPAEILDAWRSGLTDKNPKKITRRRYPYRIPLRQKGGYKVTPKQREQRERFEAIRDKFKTIPDEVKQRWYAAMPQWGSLLWYYNYFILSGLLGNAVVGDKEGGVIKDIQHHTFILPTGTPVNVTVPISTIDPAKAAFFFYGAGIRGVTYSIFALGLPNYPFLVSLNSTQAIVQASLENLEAAGCSISIIEYI